MVRVDVCSLDRDQALNVFTGGAETLAKQFRDHFNQLCLQAREALQLSRRAAVTCPDKLLVDHLDTSQTWWLQQLDLGLDKKLKGDFGNKQAWSGSGRVADCCANIVLGEVENGVDGLECVPKDVVEDVVDASTSAKLLC